MRMEIIKLDPLRTANILAVVYGAIMVAVMLIAVPIVLIVLAVSGAGSGGKSHIVLVMFLAYPIVGVIFGWLGGLLVGFVYNVAVNFTGGLLVDMRDLSPAADPTQVPPVDRLRRQG